MVAVRLCGQLCVMTSPAEAAHSRALHLVNASLDTRPAPTHSRWLWTAVLVLAGLWAFGAVGPIPFGAWIHTILIVACVAALVGLVRGGTRA